MSLRNDIMRFSILGFRNDLWIELQAPVLIHTAKLPNAHLQSCRHATLSHCIAFKLTMLEVIENMMA